MAFGRFLGWLLILGALLVVGHEVYAWLDQGHYKITAAGQLWYDLSPGSINLVQAVIQRYLLPSLWDHVLLPVLLVPAWLVLGLPGILLVILCRKRAKRRRQSSMFS
jgi:hypothetical protein